MNQGILRFLDNFKRNAVIFIAYLFHSIAIFGFLNILMKFYTPARCKHFSNTL